MEDLTSRPATSSPAPAETLTPAAIMIISLLPDTRCRAPDQGKSTIIKIFMNWLSQRRDHS